MEKNQKSRSSSEWEHRLEENHVSLSMSSPYIHLSTYIPLHSSNCTTPQPCSRISPKAVTRFAAVWANKGLWKRHGKKISQLPDIWRDGSFGYDLVHNRRVTTWSLIEFRTVKKVHCAHMQSFNSKIFQKIIFHYCQLSRILTCLPYKCILLCRKLKFIPEKKQCLLQSLVKSWVPTLFFDNFKIYPLDNLQS